MLIPVGLFEAGLWLAVVLVGAGSAYLLTILVKDWRDKKLW